jgi:hypothetical protein
MQTTLTITGPRPWRIGQIVRNTDARVASGEPRWLCVSSASASPSSDGDRRWHSAECREAGAEDATRAEAAYIARVASHSAAAPGERQAAADRADAARNA